MLHRSVLLRWDDVHRVSHGKHKHWYRGRILYVWCEQICAYSNSDDCYLLDLPCK